MEKIGKYEILEKIGTGGFGVVFKGRDPFIKRFVAIKTCNSDDEEMRHRFFREAEIAGNLQHKNVTTVYDFGFEGEVPYLVQEYLPGEDLDQVIARRALGDSQKLDYLIQIATGLAYAHAQGVIHRDIKPSNVRVVDGGRVKIMDFGIAKLANLESRLTKTGMTLGTASYLAPEQIRGDSLTLAVDIFSFGVVAYELFANRRPFEGQNLSNLFYQVLSATAPPLRTFAPSCPPALAEVIERCLGKEPEERWPDAQAVLAALEAVRATLPEPSGEGSVGATRTLVVAGDYDDGEATAALGTVAAREELAKVQQRVGELLAAGNATAAEIEVTLAQKRFAATPGAVGTLAPLLARVTEERSRKESERRRSDKVEGLVARARELLEAGGNEDAVVVLHTALEIAPDHGEAQGLLRAADEAVALAARRRALADAAAAVAARLSRGDLTAAEQELTQLEREHGATAELAALRQQLGQRRREAQAAQLRAEAERRAAADDLAGALASLREARQLLPADAELAARGAEVERLVEQRRAAAARADSLEEALILVQGAIEQRRWDEAEAQLRRAAAELGAAPELERLRQRLAAERQAERLAQQEERQAEVDQLAAQAAQRRAAGDVAGAAAQLEAALRLGADSGLSAQLAADRAELRRRQDEAARQQRLASLVAEVEAALAAGKAKAAHKLLRRSAGALGPDPALDAVAARVEAALRPPLAVAPAVEPATKVLPLPAGRSRRWIVAAAVGVPLLVALGVFWRAGDGAPAAGSEPVKVAGEAGARAAAAQAAAAAPAPPLAAPPAEAGEPGPLPAAPPAPPAPPTAPDAATLAAQAVNRARGALARGDHGAALREAAVAINAAPGDAVVSVLTSDVLRAARRSADEAARRAAAAGAADLAPGELARASSRRRAADGTAATHPLDGAREIWQSAALFDAAGSAAAAESRRRQQLAQAAAPPVVPPSAPAGTAPPIVVAPAPKPLRPAPPRPTELPAPPAPAVDETAGVQAAIARYQRASESLDASAVQAVWPTVDAGALRRAFGNYQALRMTVSGCDVRVQGDAATAACQRAQQIQPKAGKQLTPRQRVRFRLHRAAGGWLIDGIDPL